MVLEKQPEKPWEQQNLTVNEFVGIVLISLGIASLVFYFSWWFKLDRLYSPILLFAFCVMLAYGLFQIVGSWLVYLATHRRVIRYLKRDPDTFEVDIFATAYQEDIELVEHTLRACLAVNGRIKVWLLDDGDDPRLKQLAQQLNVGYLTREGSKDKKAGNINAALPRTTGEIIAIFDIDHAPHPSFLEKTLPYFGDPLMGFVQAMLTFNNEEEGWVARAASESSLDYYNPTSIGTDGMWSTTLVGSNAVIRRTALESIGGYKPGLAEDLATSVALHAKGWRSVYVEEPLAPGYAPPDMTAWFTQQLKWSRGVFEIFVTDYLKSIPMLKRGNIAAYGVRMTYYWVGFVTFLHILAVLVVILSGNSAWLYELQDYLLHAIPIGCFMLIIRQTALRKWKHQTLKNHMQWRPLLLILGTWPVYTLSWVMALCRIPLRFQPTPKEKSDGFNLTWLTPQIITAVLLIIGITKTYLETGQRYLFILLFAFVLLLPQLALLYLGVFSKEKTRQQLKTLTGAANIET